VLIVGGVVVAVVVIVILVLSLGGSKGASSSSSASAPSTSASGAAKTTTHAGKSSSAGTQTAAVNPSQTEVVVLNGTGTTGLAHRVSGELQQHGYSKATALDGTPPGTNQVTVVEYSSGHRAEAQSVASSIGAGAPQPIEGTVASMADSAPVVVIVGLDKASASQ
jgi:LytR cell envelope-related transcriptional attenuator